MRKEFMNIVFPQLLKTILRAAITFIFLLYLHVILLNKSKPFTLAKEILSLISCTKYIFTHEMHLFDISACTLSPVYQMPFIGKSIKTI